MLKQYFEQWDSYVLLRNTQLEGTKWVSEQDKIVLALFARINSISYDIITLARAKQFSSTRILMRSALESFVDLRCLVGDPEYLVAMKNAELDQQIRHLKHYSSDNRYYSSMDADKEKLKELGGSFDRKKSINIYDRFKKADALDVYPTVYNKLCLFSHGNISALASDNFENGHVVLNKFPDDITIEYIMSSTVRTAIASSIEVSAYFDHEEKIVKPFKDLLGLK